MLSIIGPDPDSPTIQSKAIFATAFSNVTLQCLVEIALDGLPHLEWHLNNSLPLKNGEKYEIEEKKTHTKCKTDFILTIVNVTDNDEGNYGCQMSDEFGYSTSATIQLKVFHQPTGKKLFYASTLFDVFENCILR